MPIEDSSPTRRNLMVVSLAFIAFCFGDAVIADNTITLAVVKVEFKNKLFLTGMAWSALLWCMYRYWLEFRGVFRESLQTEMAQITDNPLLRWYAGKQLGVRISKGRMSRNTIKSFNKESGKWAIDVSMSKPFNEALDIEEGPSNLSVSRTETVKIRSGYRKIVTSAVALQAMWRHPAFSSYAVPPLLWVAAFIGGLSRCSGL